MERSRKPPPTSRCRHRAAWWVMVVGVLALTPTQRAQAAEGEPAWVAALQPDGRLADDTISRPLTESGPQAERSWPGAADIRRLAPTGLAIAFMGLVPIVVLMASGFVRIMIVLSLLRQAFGTPGIPPNQVITAVAFLLTLLVMTPVWSEVYDQAVVPALAEDSAIDWPQHLPAAVQPVHHFMSRQIQAAGNWEDIWLFLRHLPEGDEPPGTYEEVPLRALLPAFVLSELKTAFLIGFQLYLPFLVIDLVVSATTMAMGMLMLPPQAIAVPLKLLLFVLVDGWHLVAELLLTSFVPLG